MSSCFEIKILSPVSQVFTKILPSSVQYAICLSSFLSSDNFLMISLLYSVRFSVMNIFCYHFLVFLSTIHTLPCPVRQEPNYHLGFTIFTILSLKCIFHWTYSVGSTNIRQVEFQTKLFVAHVKN